MRRHTVRNTLLFFMSLLLCQSTVDPLWAYDDDVKEIPTCKSCSVTRQAKWAFGDNAAAEAFIAESGAMLASYDQALKTAREELGSEFGRNYEKHHHAGHDMGPGALLTFTPAFGDMIYHLHPGGT